MREIRVGCIQPLGQPKASAFGGETDRAFGRQKIEENLALASRLLGQAGAAGCDIVAYPEDIQAIAHYGYFHPEPDLFAGYVEQIPGPVTDRVAEVASKYHMHVVFGTYERVGEAIYNTAVLMGREGQILGKYHKTQLPDIERWSTTPGDSFPVFETDFGTVGMMICYDINFPEVARCLSLNGAELLFHPTMGYDLPGQCEGSGLVRARARALDNFVPLVISTCGSDSVIVNSDGNVLALGRPNKEDLLLATLDLDATPMDHSQWELITGVADVKARLLQERRPATFGALVDPNPPVLKRYASTPLNTDPAQRQAIFEELYRRWTGREWKEPT
jgi:predicted amidohydrolase